jgi:xanthine dehydrogenase accessory factor
MDPLFRSLERLLDAGQSLALATIISKEGSAPRDVGSKMIVRADGAIEGTIGGGPVEASVIESAKSRIISGGAEVREFDLNSQAAIDAMDLICGGYMSVLIERIEPTPENVGLFRKSEAKHRRGERGAMVTALSPSSRDVRHTRRFLLDDCETLPREADLPEDVSGRLLAAAKNMRAPCLLDMGGRRFFMEPCASQGTVFIFGAGHVSRKVAEFAAQVDFDTVVLDDRPDFANRERFPTAGRIHILDSFEDAVDPCDLNRNSYAVIVTRGHRHDKTVLAQALRSDAAYIGMIGSRVKVNATYQALRNEGFGEDDFKRVNSPIGLSIGAQTPAEIAVSIVAELIAKRAELCAK